MQNLITHLKDQHVQISGLLREALSLGTATAEAQEKLAQAKHVLLAHLALEDAKLYPVLHEAAQGNPVLAEKIRSYADEMNEVSKVILTFFDKYSEGTEFEGEFRGIYLALTQRINREEADLFAEFAAIAPQT